MSDYRQEVMEAVSNYITDREYFINFGDYETAQDLFDDLYDDMFVCDEVTGNASGSYTFNSYEAREKVLADMDTVAEALKEFCTPAEEIGERFLNEDWEYLDVTARCYVLAEVLAQYIEDNEDDINALIAEAKEDQED
jgi:hypothetical protein